MTLWSLLLIIVVLGAFLWLIEIAPFISGGVKPFARWVVIAVVVFLLLDAIGAISYLKSITIGR